MPKYLLIILVIMLPILNGCVSEPMKLGAPQTTETVNIRLIPNDINRTDGLIQQSLWGESTTLVETEPYWSQIFVGTELSEASFEILSAFMEVEYGYSGTWTYKINGQVLCDGQTYPITAQGSRSAAWAIESAMRQSVERGIVNAAQKAKFSVENCRNLKRNN